MLMQLVEFTPEQLEQVRRALDNRAVALTRHVRETADADFLTVAQIRDFNDGTLGLVRSTLAALSHVDAVLAEQRLAELGKVTGECHTILAKRADDEAEVDAWNARVEANEKAASDLGSESGPGTRSLGGCPAPLL